MPTPGAMPSLVGSAQPEDLAPVQHRNYPPTSQNSSSSTFSYPVNNKQPSSGLSYRSNSESTWSEYGTPFPTPMDKLLTSAAVPTTYLPTSKPDFELPWRGFSIADPVNIGGRDTNDALGGAEGAVPSMYPSTSAILPSSSFHTSYTTPAIKLPALVPLTSFRNISFQDHDECTTSSSDQSAAR